MLEKQMAIIPDCSVKIVIPVQCSRRQRIRRDRSMSVLVTSGGDKKHSTHSLMFSPPFALQTGGNSSQQSSGTISASAYLRFLKLSFHKAILK